MAVVPFRLDGIAYDLIVLSLKRGAKVLDTDKSKRTQAGTMNREIIGTYYNYTLEIKRKGDTQADLEAYDSFYEVVTSPEESHSLEVPYAQTTLLFDAYVTSADDGVVFMDQSGNYWDGMTLNFIAVKPQRKPS